MLTKIDKEYVKDWSNKIRLINELGGKCEQCGTTNIFHLIFHHKSGEEKEFNIGSRCNGSYNTLLKEVKKCILLCHNCHEKHHDNEMDSFLKQNKRLYLEYKESNGCSKCGYNECNKSLTFHHIDEKTKLFAISHYGETNIDR